MKKTALFLALASIVGSAMADDTVVLKDTRTYLNPEGAAPAAVGGELLTRAGDWCDHKDYRGSDKLPPPPPAGKMYIDLLNIDVSAQHYRCDSTGAPA